MLITILYIKHHNPEHTAPCTASEQKECLNNEDSNNELVINDKYWVNPKIFPPPPNKNQHPQ